MVVEKIIHYDSKENLLLILITLYIDFVINHGKVMYNYNNCFVITFKKISNSSDKNTIIDHISLTCLS